MTMSRRARSRRNVHDSDEDEEMEEAPSQNQSRRGRNSQGQSNTRTAKKRALTAASSSQLNASQNSQVASTSRRHIDDDDYEPSQGSQKSGGSKLPSENANSLVASVIRYLLVADRSKTTIQRANIIKASLSSHSKYYKSIMIKVKSTLNKVFGYNLVELEGNKYILSNNLKNDIPHIQYSQSEKAEQVLLFITLAHIFMLDENGCREADLLGLHRNLGIIEDTDFKHEYFGDVKYLLTEKFVKQGYLDLVTDKESDPPVQYYQWGARAENELEPRSVLEFMSKVFGGRPLNTWPVQFKTMQLREDPTRRAREN